MKTMRKVNLGARGNWKDVAKDNGFTYVHSDGEPYWNEDTVYEFTAEEADKELAYPCDELQSLCLELVHEVVNSEELLNKCGIPKEFHTPVYESWVNDRPHLYGRFDMAYSGNGRAKLIEYNADTPVTVYEAAAFQWQWFEDVKHLLPEGADQFNNLYDALVARFKEIMPQGTPIHFASTQGSDEDYTTVEQLAFAALEAGAECHYTDLETIGHNDEEGFVCEKGYIIQNLFKLQPWEHIMVGGFKNQVISTKGIDYLEPMWKSILSNKAILPLLWERHKGHPNLLESYFTADADVSGNGWVEKPIFSREGSDVAITDNQGRVHKSDVRRYTEYPTIVQKYEEITQWGGFRPTIGIWMVGDESVAMGIREDKTVITRNLSQFKPHYLV